MLRVCPTRRVYKPAAVGIDRQYSSRPRSCRFIPSYRSWRSDMVSEVAYDSYRPTFSSLASKSQ